LLSEVRGLFAGYSEFQVDKWQIESQFSKEFFHGLTLSNDAEKNRRLLAERLDEETPVASAECSCSGFGDSSAEEEKALSDFIKGHHLVKLVGQLIRNSPISFDAEQKTDLVEAGFNLTLRMVSFMTELYNPMALKNLALAQLRDSVLKAGNRAELEAKLSGIIYGLLHLLVFSALRHACCFLAHPDLALTYQKLLNVDSEDPRFLTQKLITCGLNFELRSPNAGSLERVCGSLTPAGQDILRTWAWMFLWYNRVSVSKRQAILESLEMTPAAQLLLPKAT